MIIFQTKSSVVLNYSFRGFVYFFVAIIKKLLKLRIVKYFFGLARGQNCTIEQNRVSCTKSYICNILTLANNTGFRIKRRIVLNSV